MCDQPPNLDQNNTTGFFEATESAKPIEKKKARALIQNSADFNFILNAPHTHSNFEFQSSDQRLPPETASEIGRNRAAFPSVQA